jgi:ubiquinone/menaquinone biosynthesis C-methylase UbiE
MVRLHTKRQPPAASSNDVRALYDRLAPGYDRFRERWLALAGAEAEAAMLAGLAPLLAPSARVLDAGCGTGAAGGRVLAGCGTGAPSRRMLAICPQIELTMLDLSPRMLARTAGLRARACGQRARAAVRRGLL